MKILALCFAVFCLNACSSRHQVLSVSEYTAVGNPRAVCTVDYSDIVYKGTLVWKDGIIVRLWLDTHNAYVDLINPLCKFNVE